MKTVFVLIAVIAALAAIMLFLLKRLNDSERKLFACELELKNAAERERMAKKIEEVKKKNREEADEKIVDIHCGDSVGNAIDVLSERGSRGGRDVCSGNNVP